jgi:hypothetical protein
MKTSTLSIKLEPKTLLSTLWIFLAVNYIYRDILTAMEAETLKGYLAGYIGDITVTQGFLLVAALMMEISFVMIVLSRVLNGKANRLANIIASILLVLIEIGTMGFGTAPTLHYLFYSVIVIACNVIIAWYALKNWNTTE